MDKGVLYDRSTTLPRIRGHFHRLRLDRLLTELLDRRLIVVTAGAGWGKTHAVSSFLKGAPARAVWFQLSELDNHLTRFWEEFVYIIASQNEGAAAQLEQLGFPGTLAKFDQFLHILAKEIYAGEQYVFVFDDFHLIQDESVTYFVRSLVAANLENTCIILISRIKPNFSGLFANDTMGLVTAEDLYFTLDETEEYLKQNNISLSTKELKRVHDFIEGWPLALFLVGLSIKKGGMVSNDPIADAVPLLFELIERELFSGYPTQVQRSLIKASLVGVIYEGLIRALAGEHLSNILEFWDSNMFIYHNLYTGHYHFHHLFLEFLKGKQKYLTWQEMDDTYLTAAEWCAANGLKLDALSHYDKCGRYEEILNIMVQYGAATFPKTTADFLLDITGRCPKELVKKNPIMHVLRAGLLLNNAEIQPALEELIGTQKELEALPPTEENRTVLGNIYFMLGLLSMASQNYDFVKQFQKAGECLPRGGMIDNSGKPINTKYAIMLNSPAPGELKKMEEALFAAMPYAAKAMHGYGKGMEYLASAEAAYFTGDMKKAAKNAYEAIYRAQEKQVSDVASSGYFLLMRIEAANGNYQGVISHLEQLRNYVEGLENKLNFNGMLDVAEGWFNTLVGSTERVVGWIVDNASDVLAPYSTGMERLVKARCMLRDGKYHELLAWIGQSEELFRQDNMWLVLLDNLIYKSAASHYIHDELQTVAALQGAYEIAHGNNLFMQFAELGGDMRAVIRAAKHSVLNTVPEAWLDEISTKAATYEKHQKGMKAQYQRIIGASSKPSVKLTNGAREMIRYLCQGLTNAEIAETRSISLSAVKKSLNNIYIKLGATNRADAVRIAIQMELNK